MTSHLIKQVRPDKNGHMVTRLVRPEGDAPAGRTLTAPPTLLAAAQHPQEQPVVPVPKQRSVTIRPEQVDRAVRRLEAANKRLLRADMPGFTWTVEQREENMVPRNPKGFNGLVEFVPVVDLVIDYPEVKSQTHDFVGSMTDEESGMITRLREGTDLGDWRPVESYCDHCGTHRRRNATYVVRDRETGEYSQVGSSCVEGYLGVDPAHLFSLNFDPLGDDVEDLTDKPARSTGGYEIERVKCDVRKALALALVVSNDGAQYRAREDWFQSIPSQRQPGDRSTHGAVLSALMDVSDDHKDRAWIEEQQQRAEERLKDGSVDTFIASVLSEDAGSNEYMGNLQVLLSGEQCGVRNLGLLVSAVKVYERKNAAKEDEHRVNEWLGAPKEKIAGVKAKIERVRYTENQWGRTTIITMLADSGHELTWFASNAPDVVQGDKVDISKATIKGHEEWNGKKSTTITYTKLEVTEAAPREEETGW